MPLKSGYDQIVPNFNQADFADSMAKAMENAFLSAWPSIMGNDIPVPDPNNQMRLMFVAVARGMVEHLVANDNSFLIRLSSDDSHLNTVYIDIDGN